MQCVILACVAFAALMITSDADRETVTHAAHSPIDVEHFIDGEHNEDFDHEAILGPDQHEYDLLPPEIAKEKLRLLAARIDTSHDGYVQEQELIDWILNQFRTLDEHDAHDRYNDQDIDHNGQISWDEYLVKVYGYKPEDFEEFRKDESGDMDSFLHMVDWDKKKFDVADKDKNGQLDAEEFPAFLHPYNHGHMYDVEIQRVLSEHDKDKDGFIDFKEFLGDSPPQKEHEIFEKEQFQNYDTNFDGKLEGDEIQSWVLPDHHGMAEDETNHLFHQTDKNNDKRLSFDEIVDKHELWVGSQATDYGRHLHDAGEL